MELWRIKQEEEKKKRRRSRRTTNIIYTQTFIMYVCMCIYGICANIHIYSMVLYHRIVFYTVCLYSLNLEYDTIQPVILLPPLVSVLFVHLRCLVTLERAHHIHIWFGIWTQFIFNSVYLHQFVFSFFHTRSYCRIRSISLSFATYQFAYFDLFVGWLQKQNRRKM